MANLLTVWGRRNAFNVQKVLWLVDELGLEHRHIDAGGSFGGLDTPEFLALNPNGRVPVIRDGDAVVWESHSILRYLAARHAAGRFWPEDPAERSYADRWTDWTLASLQPAFLGLFWDYYRTPEDQRNPALVEAGREKTNQLFRLLDRHLDGRSYLAGDRITIADVAAGTALFRYFGLDLDRPALPNVEAWHARLRERPAYRRNVEVPFEDLKGRLSF